MDINIKNIVLSGTCLYAGTTKYRVLIVRSDIYYGTGDFYDTPAVADDRQITCYHVWYENLLSSGKYSAGGGQFLSVDEAVAQVEKFNPDVVWQK